MNISDLRSKSDGQLHTELLQLKKEQLSLRFQAATGQLEKFDRVCLVRRTIARIKTLQRERFKAPPSAP